MNLRSTKFLVFLALALGAFIYFYERNLQSTTERQDVEQRAFPALRSELIRTVEVYRLTNRVLRVVRQGQRWVETEPVRFPADSDQVEGYLTRLGTVHFQTWISADQVARQTNGLAAFGLRPPKARVVLIGTDGRHEIRFGSPTAVGNLLYFQVLGMDRVLTVPTSILEALPSSPDGWRDRALLAGVPEGIDRIVLLPLTNGVELVRNPDGSWHMKRPLELPAHTQKIEFLLQQLRMTRIAQFVDDTPEGRLDLYGLVPPQREIAFYVGGTEVCRLQIGRIATNRADFFYVRNRRYSPIFLASRVALEPWLQGFQAFCDRRLMVFDPKQVEEIEVTGRTGYRLVRLGTNRWDIVEPYQTPADPALVKNLLTELARMEFVNIAQEAPTNWVLFGLDPPVERFVLRGKQRKGKTNVAPVLAQLDLGYFTQNALRFVRRGTENCVLLAPENPRIPREAIYLRGRQIWAFPTNSIVSIAIRQHGITEKRIREKAFHWVNARDPSQRHPSLSIEETAFRLGHLYADRWVDHGEAALQRYGFPKADCTITLEVQNQGKIQKYELRLGGKAPQQRCYGAVRLDPPGEPVVFEVPESLLMFLEQDLLLEPLP